MDPGINFDTADWVDVPDQSFQTSGKPLASLNQIPLDQKVFNSSDWEDIQPKKQEQKEREQSDSSFLKNAGNNISRIAGQLALGAGEAAALPYDIATASLGNKDAQNVAYRQILSEDLESMLEQKMTGVWNETDEKLLQHTIEQIKDPSKSGKFVQTADVSLQSLAERATGIDLAPKGLAEKAARWTGWIKNPNNIANLARSGISKTSLAKAVLPSKTEAFRGLAAGAALQAAEDGELGPIGTIAASIAADIAAGGVSKLAKSGVQALKAPKQSAAKLVASFTKQEKQQLQKSIINDFKKSGIQADLGTITDNNAIRWIQSRLAQSGLTGSSLDGLKNKITSQVKNEYKEIAEGLGKFNYTNNFEAGLATKDAIGKIRKKDLSDIRKIYQASDAEISSGAKVFTDRLIENVNKLEKSLSPGSIKSSEQKAVLDSLSKLKKDLTKSHPQGKVASVQDLINNKKAIQDIINYEVQGGAKQLLKGIAAELDRSIISYGKSNPNFAKKYIEAQKKFSVHAKTFRNKNIDQILKSQDPAKVMAKMTSVQGIRDVKKALFTNPVGVELFNDLKRFKLDELVGNNMVDGITNQLKLGTFSKLLTKGKNKELLKEILGKDSYKRLERLSANSGKLADSMNKFFNSSQSATTAGDAAVILTLFKQFGNLMSGNAWPLMKGASGLFTAKKLSKLISDPEFLKLTEEAMIALNSKNPKRINFAVESLKPYALSLAENAKEKDLE